MNEQPEIFKKTISNDEISELPLRTFDGDLVLIDSTEGFDRAIQDLKQQELLGFDTETRPSFKKGKTHTVALLQLSTATTAYLFRLNSIGLPEALANVLASPNIVKVGAAIRDDIKSLQARRRFAPGGFVELQSYVKDFQIENFGLKKLAAIVLGIRISKAQRLTNWEKKDLTLSQQLYAATDAWVCHRIYDKLQRVATES